LMKGKAWGANRNAFLRMSSFCFPVIYLTIGRPTDRRFGGSDTLLGIYRMQQTDVGSLSCTLTAVATEGVALSASAIFNRAKTILGVSKENCGTFKLSSCKRKRRELQVYSCAGGHMGPPPAPGAPELALTGAHSKDLYVRSLANASVSVRLNAYCISDPDVLEELRRASVRGLSVQIRYDYRQQSKTASCFDDDRLRHIYLHPIVVSEDEKCLMHKKELIVDSESEANGHLVVGSYNPTSNAKGSQESVVVLRDPSVVRAFAARFDFDWHFEDKSAHNQTSKTTFTSDPLSSEVRPLL